MRLLVLGSEGFIGSHCVDYFLAKGSIVYGIDLFEQPSKKYHYKKVSRLSPDFDELFATQALDAVINAAGSGNVPYSMAHPISDFEANSLDTIRVLDAIRKHQPACKYLHISSAAVYGNPVTLPVKEQDRSLPLSPYGWHKLIAETICHEYSAVYNLSIAIIRPFSVYGPGLKKQLIWDIFQQLIENKSIELFGTGDESRDFIYVSDLVRAIDYIINSDDMRCAIYNVASGEEIPIRVVVKSLLSVTGIQTTYRFNQVSRNGDPTNWKADIGKLQSLGFSPSISFQDGLSKVNKWIQDEKR